ADCREYREVALNEPPLISTAWPLAASHRPWSVEEWRPLDCGFGLSRLKARCRPPLCCRLDEQETQDAAAEASGGKPSGASFHSVTQFAGALNDIPNSGVQTSRANRCARVDVVRHYVCRRCRSLWGLRGLVVDRKLCRPSSRGRQH